MTDEKYFNNEELIIIIKNVLQTKFLSGGYLFLKRMAIINYFKLIFDLRTIILLTTKQQDNLCFTKLEL